MWDFQPHFRIRVELRIEEALRRIGLPVDVRVILVGFALDGSLHHQICIEPEVGPLSVNHLGSVLGRTKELLNANPESRIRISDPRYQKRRRESLYRQSRGSRYNSAVRYQSTACAGSIVVVISDDGTVDLVPRLRPRVRREHVEEAVRAFPACCEAEYVDGGEFSRTYDLVKSFAFYLDDEQCRIVNEHYETEMNRRFEGGDLALFLTPLQPHPDMNESYFL